MVERSLLAFAIGFAAVCVGCSDFDALDWCSTESCPDAATVEAGFCASSHHAVCADFDDGGMAPWLPSLSGGSTLQIDDAASVSPPNSLLATLPSSGQPSAAINTSLDAGAHMICQVDVRLDAAPEGFRLFTLGASDPSLQGYAFIVEIDPDTIRVQELGTWQDGGTINQTTQLGVTLPRETWETIQVDVDLANDAGATVAIGSVSQPIGLTPKSGSWNGGVTVGATVTDPVSMATKVRIDNLWCDLPSP